MSPISYEALPHDEEQKTERQRRGTHPVSCLTSQKRLGIAIASILSIITICAVALLAAHLNGWTQSSVPSAEDIESPCGNTTVSARAANCTFDPMSFSWLPPRCYDGELTAQFLAHTAGPWHWYTDINKTAEVAQSEVLLGGHHHLYVKWEYHLVHCTFMWRKMHRAVLNSWPIDGYIGSYGHTEHCEHGLLSDMDREDMNTVIASKWPSCPKTSAG